MTQICAWLFPQPLGPALAAPAAAPALPTGAAAAPLPGAPLDEDAAGLLGMWSDDEELDSLVADLLQDAGHLLAPAPAGAPLP